MIVGILDKNRAGDDLRQELSAIIEQKAQGASIWASGPLAFCSIPRGIPTLDETSQPFVNEDETITIMFAGKIYNLHEIKKQLGSGPRFRTKCSGEALVHLYELYQDQFLKYVNGKFGFALWDQRKQVLILGRDRLGIETMYYHEDGGRLVFGSSLQSLLPTGWIEKQLNHQAVLQYLLYCYNPLDETFFRNVYKLPAGHMLSFNGSATSLKRYWRLSYADTKELSEPEYGEEVLDLIRDAIRIRLNPNYPPGLFLSGGTDSSAILSLTSELCSQPVYTFGFRCQGRTYDESSYARWISAYFGATHTEVPYGSDRLVLISQAVKSMDEPLCDIGIELATFILGQAAQSEMSYVFSGEGGDELFAGHPVYVADKVAAVVDHVPRTLFNPVKRMLYGIPDSDEKKNLQVMLKRFAYSLGFPPTLLSHRWRTYYTRREIEELCTADFLAECDLANMFEGMAKHGRDADGQDRLSRSLYCDYNTLVGFYLCRLGLLRAFRLESRLPLLDYRLVEYAAKIPSRLKIKGFSDTKYIYKKILEPVVPRKILYDRPKLGHSVPMKNWLRDAPAVNQWLSELLSDNFFKDIGFFREEYVQRMLDEHLRKRHNHSHRLWGLSVLTAWLHAWSN
ncbi:MAG: asparagine synthase (glutamine-hydrolyzing) [Acidiferrobacterales bacterium]